MAPCGGQEPVLGVQPGPAPLGFSVCILVEGGEDGLVLGIVFRRTPISAKRVIVESAVEPVAAAADALLALSWST